MLYLAKSTYMYKYNIVSTVNTNDVMTSESIYTGYTYLHVFSL